MSRSRLAWTALAGAVLAAALVVLVVLVSQPWRMRVCATPSGVGQACAEGRVWNWPAAFDLSRAAVVGAVVAVALALPLLRGRR
jgi:uncharacterized integral membrane protein